MRQVPDNQEVFVHPCTDQSIIMELLEYQAGVPDENAASPLSSSAAQGTEVPPPFSQAPWTVEHFHIFVRSLRLHDPGIFG
ncbi:hypothetical protein JD844_001089 [Phrynosoma platyrhinos]|uniref:Uncharacterized protein n=1 Tax=Phrynosoma platyrhinos TaxID=52577 RepID=A0ABQ7T9P1_PHRPL|nr:hypothetical protein JD844_001089 [Phrynosoma platyrhinos]